MPEETFSKPFVIPGTYIRVRAEALISAGAIATGNIGIVGTFDVGAEVDAEANEGVEGRQDVLGETHLLSGYEDAVETFGPYDEFPTGDEAEGPSYNLVRSVEQLYRNGASTVYARGLDPEGPMDWEGEFRELLKEEVNILVAPERPTDAALGTLKTIVAEAEDQKQDVIAVVGSDLGPDAEAGSIVGQVEPHKRIVFTAPGFQTRDAARARRLAADDSVKVTPDKVRVTLPGKYTAAVVAGLLSRLAPQTSPTHKGLPGVGALDRKFAAPEVEQLLGGGVMVLEDRGGVRVVRGITSEHAVNGPYAQVTTRRIVNYAKAGIREAADPFVGRLNNARVRKALQGAIDGFLNNMVQDEALTEYQLQVSATRQDEIEGKARVRAVLKPTFSIDFVAVTLTLQ